jgi:nanoRNase/pAp phosphatase (c-di-AMP/oligoRNAs hydrolase)
MAEPTTDLSNLRVLVNSAQAVVIAVGPQPTLDQWAVATALQLVLEQAGKSVVLAAPRKLVIPENSPLQPLVGLDQVTDSLGKRDLVVSFAYDESAVDAVSYAIGAETQRFYLTIKPKPGHKPLAAETVEFTYAGVDADLIFLIGVHELPQLAQLYTGYEELYTKVPVVTIHTFAPEIGQIRLDTSKSTCSAEALVKILLDLGLALTPVAASNLLYAIDMLTDGLSSFSVTADTFETAAELLRAGARRFRRPVRSANNSVKAPSVPINLSLEQGKKSAKSIKAS